MSDIDFFTIDIYNVFQKFLNTYETSFFKKKLCSKSKKIIIIFLRLILDIGVIPNI